MRTSKIARALARKAAKLVRLFRSEYQRRLADGELAAGTAEGGGCGAPSTKAHGEHADTIPSGASPTAEPEDPMMDLQRSVDEFEAWTVSLGPLPHEEQVDTNRAVSARAVTAQGAEP